LDFALAESSYWIDAPVVIEEPVSRWELGRGYVFPIEGDGATVGAVFVAEGTWTVRFERASDAVVTANRLAVLEHVDPAELLSVVQTQELVQTVDRGWVLAHDAWPALLPSLRLVERSDKVLVSPAPDAAEEILVVDQNLAQARRIAEQLLEERTAWMRRYAFDPGSLLQADALQADALRSRLMEFRTSQSWDRFAGDTQVGADQRWLAYLRDPSGAFDRESRAVVLAQGVLNERLVRKGVARERFPAGPDGVHRSPQRVDLVTASATAVWDREGGGSTLTDRVVADLQVTAVGGPARLVWVDVPHIEQQPLGAHPPLAEGWSLEGITTTEGEPLTALHLPLTSDQTQGRGPVRTYAVLLPQALAAGETLTLRVAWRDRHRYARIGGIQVGEGRGGIKGFANYGLGTSTDPIPVLPRLRTHASAPGPARVRVGVRPWLAQRDRVAVSGVRTGIVDEGGYRYVETLTTTSAPAMVIGDWTEQFESARMDFPAVRSLLQNQGSEVGRQLPVEVRALLNGWGQMLPRYPAGEVQLAELAMTPYQMGLWLVGDGLVPVQPAQVLGGGPRGSELRTRHRTPHVERMMLATALHGHWWTATGLAPGVGDLPRILAIVYGIKTLGARFGEEVEDEWFYQLRIAASTVDHRVEGHQGAAFALGRTLTGEVSDAALYEAVDRTLQGEFPPTLDGLQAALEASTGRELDDFFDLWLRSGLAPQVSSAWSQQDGQVEVELVCDVPFSSLEVPVRVRGARTWSDQVVHIQDGRGVVRLPFGEAVREVLVDPDKRLLLLRRAETP
jgi:hypothetical protein